MEKASNVYLVEGNFEWNDLGSWESVYQNGLKDKNGNANNGDAIFLDSNNSYVHSENGIVAVVGMTTL